MVVGDLDLAAGELAQLVGELLGGFLMARAGFSASLSPLYDVFCEITGIGTREQLTRAGTAAGQTPVVGRTVVVEFTASVPAGGWEFEPVAVTMEIQPGRLYETHYRARRISPHGQ